MDKKGHFTFEDIVLDDNKNRYQAGEQVSGFIKFALRGSNIVNNIRICLISVSEVSWVEIPNTPHYIGLCTYHDKIKLMEQIFPLPKEFLYEGEHKVPFAFQLPEKGIPSSFDGPNGSIKYTIEVQNEEHGGNEVHIVGVHEFEVDVPSDQNLSLSIGCSKEKDFGLLSLASGKLTLYASFKKKGWAPGELIDLHVTVDNQSSVDVTPRAILYQIQVYMCDERHKGFQIQLTEEIVGKKVDKHKNNTQSLFIPTPEDVPLTIKSPLISVKYFVHVTLDIPHAIDIHVDVPVVMTKHKHIPDYPTFISSK